MCRHAGRGGVACTADQKLQFGGIADPDPRRGQTTRDASAGLLMRG